MQYALGKRLSFMNTPVTCTFWERILFEREDDRRGHDRESSRADEPKVERVYVLYQLQLRDR